MTASLQWVERSTEKCMTSRFAMSAVVAAMMSLGLFGTACGTAGEESAESAATVQSPKLNLSHIECTEDGNVLAHFVLLFAGKSTPAPLTGTWSGGTFGPVSAYKSSGNVWHYEVILPSGYVEILSASVGTVTLHNPSEYSGDYQCGDVPVCEVVVEAQDVFCTDKPLGNPGDECAEFGLVPAGKDDDLTGLTFTATMDAYVAIVKSGNHGCSPGESAYRIYVNVHEGDSLQTPADQNISHVTYCDCSTPAQ
jgi:hypothetical protein